MRKPCLFYAFDKRVNEQYFMDIVIILEYIEGDAPPTAHTHT